MPAKQPLAQVIANNLSFFIPYVFILGIVGVLQLDFSQTALMLALHKHYHPWADFLFSIITTLGEGLGFFTALALFFIFRKGKNAIIVLTSAEIVSALLAQLFKQKIFDHIDRPVKFFEGAYQGFHLPNGTDALLQDHSFPSGHTTSAFTIFCVSTLYAQNKNWGYFFILMAFLVGYSRVYLFQHFVVDTYFGSMLGIFCAIAAFYLFNHRFKQ
jgi:membrane-associated phospholipid phosphatase